MQTAKQKSVIRLGIITALGLSAVGCSSGDLRLLNDAMYTAGGGTVTWPDQSNVEYIDDVKWTTGVRNGTGFQRIENTGSDYCKVRVKYEDGSYGYFRLDPHEGTGSQYVDNYNQTTYLNTICGPYSSVYNETFND